MWSILDLSYYNLLATWLSLGLLLRKSKRNVNNFLHFFLTFINGFIVVHGIIDF